MIGSMSIKTKIWLGYGLLLTVLLLVSGLTLFRSNGVQNDVNEVVKGRQPTVILSKELAAQLRQAASSLGFYLLSHEQEHIADYEQSMLLVKQAIDDLKSLPTIAQDSNSSALVQGIETDIGRFRSLEAPLLAAAESYEKNFPGIDYANTNVNPISRQMLQLTSQMILSEMEEEPNEERKRLLVDIAELRYVWSNVMSGIRGYLAFRSDSSIKDLELYIQHADELVSRISSMEDELTLDQADSFEQFKGAFSRFGIAYKQMLTIHGSEHWRTDSWLVRSEVGPIFHEINAKLGELVETQENGILQTSSALLNNSQETTRLVLMLLVFGVVAGITIAGVIAKSISRPIRFAAATMQDIANGEGDLTRQLLKCSHDEIGQLADGFNLFVAKIRDLILQVSHSSASVIEAVMQTTEKTSRITGKILEQEAETAQVATAINQMTATISEVAKNAATAEGAAQAASKEALQGHAVVTATAEAILSLAQEVAAAEQVVREVGRQSEEIGAVLDVIKNIAEQTNLLALNAAIEAARAGEQGRGFAVVADEVRNLANRTQHSTVEIESMIQHLQGGTRRAVEVMGAGHSKAETSVSHAKRALQSLEGISEAIATINEMNTQIATAAAEQETVADSINRNAVNINIMSSEASQDAKEVTEIIDSLGRLVSELQTVVHQFKTVGDQSIDFETAKAAHLAWRTRLRAFLDGRQALTPEEAVSDHDCVLGRWNYGEGLKHYGNIPAMRQIEAPHSELHRLIQEIVRLKEAGRYRDAEAEYEKIEPLSGQIIQLLDDLEAQARRQ